MAAFTDPCCCFELFKGDIDLSPGGNEAVVSLKQHVLVSFYSSVASNWTKKRFPVCYLEQFILKPVNKVHL